jgi:hypothetical protein
MTYKIPQRKPKLIKEMRWYSQGYKDALKDARKINKNLDLTQPPD